MKKSILAILLAVVMVASLLPMAALADELWAEAGTADTFSAALDAGGKIKLTADIVVSTKQNWTVTKDVILDLNGHKITSSYGEMNNYLFTVKNGASFTVTDNSEAKDGIIEATDNNYGYGIQLKGTNSSFTLLGGTIKTTQETVDIYTITTGCKIEISGGKLISTDDSAMNARGKSTVVNITGGELISEGGIAGIFVSSGGSSDVNSIVFNMTGGSLVSDYPGILTDYALTVNIGGTANISSSSTGISVKGTTVLNVEGGTIASSGASAISANYNNKVNISGGNISTTGYSAAAIQIGENSTATISGGNVSSKNTNKNITGNTKNITISGGTFQQNVSAYLPEGLKQDAEGNVVINTEDKNVVASIGSTTYNNFHDAVAAAQSGETVKLWKNTTVDSWEQIWNLSNVVIDGQRHELTVGAVTSNGNGNYLVYNAENLTVEDLTITFTTNGNGFTLDSGKFESVNMYAGESSSYAIFVGTSNKEDAKVEINACYFEGFDAAVYSQPGNGTTGVTSDISITNSIFDECDLTVCSYAAETVFNGNTVRDCGSNSFAGGVDKGNTNVTYEIKNNTFEDGGKIWFYDGNLDNVVFKKNRVQGNTYLSTDNSESGTLDVANNYWGGGAPNENQIQGSGEVTGKDKYYLEPTMDDDDISVFYDVYYVYNNGAGMGYERVLKGESVTLTTPSKSGYAFLGWACTDGKVYDGGDKVAIWGNTTFEASWVRHPDTPYVPEPEQPEQPETPVFPFYDVPTSAWYYTAVKYVYDNKLMDGVDTYVFAPNDTLTRAMVWTIIARMSGVDTTGGANWYAKAQEWVITNGISDGENPTAAITREQLVTMLYRYAQIKGYDVSVGENTNILSYVDATSISEYAMSAFQWACGSGLTEGDENGALTPLATATRAQAAAMIMRFCQSVK